MVNHNSKISITKSGLIYFTDRMMAYHQVGLPYMTTDDRRIWLFDDNQVHRLDGPAIEFPDNPEKNEWYYYGTKINCSTLEEFNRMIDCKVLW